MICTQPYKQTDEFILDEAITLARSGFQAITIEDRHCAVVVGDEPGGVKTLSGDRYTGPAHAKHHREKLLRHRKAIVIGSVKPRLSAVYRFF